MKTVRRAPKAGESAREGDNGKFRTTNLGIVMAVSGLRPAESLLNNRSRRHVLMLMSLPKGDQAKSLPATVQPWDNGWSASASTPGGWKIYSCRRTDQRNSAPAKGGFPTGVQYSEALARRVKCSTKWAALLCHREKNWFETRTAPPCPSYQKKSLFYCERVRVLSVAASLVGGYVVRAALILGAQFLRIIHD